VCGYKLANDGHDTRALQLYLGHRQIQHTVRYTACRRRVRRLPLAGLAKRPAQELRGAGCPCCQLLARVHASGPTGRFGSHLENAQPRAQAGQSTQHERGAQVPVPAPLSTSSMLVDRVTRTTHGELGRRVSTDALTISGIAGEGREEPAEPVPPQRLRLPARRGEPAPSTGD
jgi:hypothetical protein